MAAVPHVPTDSIQLALDTSFLTWLEGKGDESTL